MLIKFPKLVFLMETRSNNLRMEFVKRMINLEHCFTIQSYGLSGGLALLWSSDVDLTILSYSKWHINAWLQGIAGKV